MKNKSLFYAVLIIGLLIPAMSSAQNNETKTYEDILNPNAVLDSTQIALKKRVAMFMANKISERGDTLYISSSKEDFLNNDIPEYFYNRLNADLKNANVFIKEGKAKPSDIICGLQKLYSTFLKE